MPGFRIAVPATTERVALAMAVGLVAAAAWAVLWSASPNFHGILHVHGRTEIAGAFQLSSLLMFVVAWTGMSLAMMLPTSLPVLAALHTFASERPDRALVITLAAMGYLAAWM